MRTESDNLKPMDTSAMILSAIRLSRRNRWLKRERIDWEREIEQWFDEDDPPGDDLMGGDGDPFRSGSTREP